jgi:outer membrane murein-binding lipoprotein Lpp
MGVRFGAVALIAATLFVSGCAQVEQFTDRTSICVDALKAAGFTPNVSDPAQSVEEARQAAEELNALAGQTPDQALKQALTDMAGTIGDFDPQDVPSWLTSKGRQLEALRGACS